MFLDPSMVCFSSLVLVLAARASSVFGVLQLPLVPSASTFRQFYVMGMTLAGWGVVGMGL